MICDCGVSCGVGWSLFCGGGVSSCAFLSKDLILNGDAVVFDLGFCILDATPVSVPRCSCRGNLLVPVGIAASVDLGRRGACGGWLSSESVVPCLCRHVGIFCGFGCTVCL